MVLSQRSAVVAGTAAAMHRLDTAIDQAQRLAWSLGAAEASVAEIEGVYRRLESARIEIETLRGGAWPARRAEPDPMWTSLFNLSGKPD